MKIEKLSKVLKGRNEKNIYEYFGFKNIQDFKNKNKKTFFNRTDDSPPSTRLKRLGRGVISNENGTIKLVKIETEILEDYFENSIHLIHCLKKNIKFF